eukprot:Skav226067  [mRNA]  locus=scaffold211:609064:615202:- [translate_table: standard]
MSLCNKCGTSAPFADDSWCLACSALEQLGAELKGPWPQAGTRAITNDLVCTCLRQVRALRKLGLALGAGSTKPPEPLEPPKWHPASREGLPPSPGAKRTASRTLSRLSRPTRRESHLRALETSTKKRKTRRRIGQLPPSPRRLDLTKSPTIEKEELVVIEEVKRGEEASQGKPDQSFLGCVRGRAIRGAPASAIIITEVAMAEGDARREHPASPPIPYGKELTREDPEWNVFLPAIQDVIEVGLHGSSITYSDEAWAAVLITASTRLGPPREGLLIEGKLLGCEAELKAGEVGALVRDGRIHLCTKEPCNEVLEGSVWHASRARVWELHQFNAHYLSREGKAMLTKARKRDREPPPDPRKGKPKGGEKPSKGRTGQPPKKRKRRPPKAHVAPIEISSEGEELEDYPFEEEELGDDVTAGGDRLRSLLRQTRERIAQADGDLADVFGGGAEMRPSTKRRKQVVKEEEFAGGPRPRPSGYARDLNTGTILSRPLGTALALGDRQGSNGPGASSSTKKRTTTALLLAQAVQQNKASQKKKSSTSKGSSLVKALKKAVGKSKRGKRNKAVGKTQRRMKPDPDPDDEDDEDEEESSGSEESDTDLEMEPPLRRRAAKSPGSVMEMLIKHIQEQMDQTAIADQPHRRGEALIGGIKVSTYFAMLIRPYYPAGSPLLRELFSLGQTMDLLRSGKLSEAADALAARFISVHTALAEGNWSTAAHLELYPLGTGHIDLHRHDVGGPAAQEIGVEKHGILHDLSKALVGWIRQGAWKWLRKGPQRRQPQRERQRKEQRYHQGLRKRKGGQQSLEEQQGRPPEEGFGSVTSLPPLQGGSQRRVFPEPLSSANLCGLDALKAAANYCTTLPRVGRALFWLLANAEMLKGAAAGGQLLWTILVAKNSGKKAMHRGRGSSSRSPFPLPSGRFGSLQDCAKRTTLDEFCSTDLGGADEHEIWTALSGAGVNGLAGHSRAFLLSQEDAVQKRAWAALEIGAKRALDGDVHLDRTPWEAEKELASRFLSYTGEEVPKMQVITVEQVAPALPPETHSGSIDALDLLCEGSRSFLLRPEDSLLDSIPVGTWLQSKVHIKPGDELTLAKLLVERKICTWVPREDVLEVNGTKVLNGLFAVGKGALLESGLEIQRLIMNLVPTNSVLKQTQGGTPELPGITQYLSLVVDGSDELRFFQSDMSAAFYLFRIPSCWSRMMAFNLSFRGTQLGFADDGWFHLGCAVIPMGWGSSVSIMQEIADRLTTIGGHPENHKVRRTAPLPVWLVQSVDEARRLGKSWYHVYLDNFCAMQHVKSDEQPLDGVDLHRKLEQAWVRTGILSSEKKRVHGEHVVQELGALVDGKRKLIGGSNLRVLKLIQVTLVVISKAKVRTKWVQVLVGRWVHLFSFRRPAMIIFDEVWKLHRAVIGAKVNFAKVRAELFGCCLLAMLLHTDLSSEVSHVTTASDASSSGGAVGISRSLTSSGNRFVEADLQQVQGGVRIPVLVLSLFNGIGCCFRCYDLCGVQPLVGLSYEISKEANRVTSRRWPWVQQMGDVRELTAEVIRDWRYKYPEVEEIHLWGGFPCVDLSSAKFGRKNLEGSESSLFWELIRVLKTVRQVYGFSFQVIYFAENVASMDRDAERQISQEFGSKPYKVDSCEAVPLHRPRFCWSNVTLHPLEDVWLSNAQHWVEVHLEHEYPSESQWLSEGAVWGGTQYGTILPTCMKAIRRVRPPPRPAGLNRADQDTVLRWEADNFRFPPYQYSEQFIVWVGNCWRLISAAEREVLHGLGEGHTKVCWNANLIKENPQGYEDIRKSLVGDSFSCYSFVYFAAMACYRWMPKFTYHDLVMRMGLAPGFCCPLSWQAPLARYLQYGQPPKPHTVQQLNKALLRRVNHTGSDVRISTGTILNAKAFPRQSVEAVWWQWDKAFAYKWQRQDHINSLELRSIIHAVEWRVRHLKDVHARIFHVTDSYICMSVIAKGRSSSRMLRPLLQRLAGWLLAFNLYLVICHVESTENPTDAASRA